METGDFEGAREIRDRKHTAKGKEYQIELLEDQRRSAQREWRKQLNRIENLLADTSDPSNLQNERMFLETKMDILVATQDRLSDALEEDLTAKRTAVEKFETWETEHSDALRRINTMLHELRQDKESLRSSTSRSTRSSRKSEGGSSSKASGLSARNRKAESAAKIAKLKTELMFTDAETRRTAALKEQEDELRKFRLTKELAVAKAEMEAVSKVEDSEFPCQFEQKETTLPILSDKNDLLQDYLTAQASSASNVCSEQTLETDVDSVADPEMKPINQVKGNSSSLNPNEVKQDQAIFRPKDNASIRCSSYPSTLNPFAQDFVSFSTPKTHMPACSLPGKPEDANSNTEDPTRMLNHSDGGDALNRLADLLTQRQARDLLPLPEPETFRGDLLHYPTWQKSFDTIIEKRTDNSSQRLYYLGKYITGEAKEAIRGLLSLDSAEAYTEARKILAERYGNPFLVTDAYRKRINEWPKIPPNDGLSLRKFSDFLLHCQTATKEIKYLKVLDDPDENQKMLRKLPRYLVDRWGREVDRWLTKEPEELTGGGSINQMRKSDSSYPPFSAFCKFLKRESRIACNPVISNKLTREEDVKGDQEAANKSNHRFQRRKCFATDSSEIKHDSQRGIKEERMKKKEFCHFCKNAHSLEACKEFMKISLQERRQFIHARGLCHGCLAWGHIRKDCRNRKSCSTCNGPHATILHDDSFAANKQASTTPDAEATSRCVAASKSGKHAECLSHSLIVPVWLSHEDNPHTRVLTYALLDDQSDACFVKETILKKLSVNGPNVQLKLSTVLAEEVVTCEKISGLVVQGFKEAISIHLPETYSRGSIPASKGQIPRPETARNWPHLASVADQLMPYREDVEVGILIGTNCTRAIKPQEIIPGNDDDPYAKRTALGWGIIGIVNRNKFKEDDGECFCHRIVSLEVEPSLERKRCHFAFKTQVKEIINPSQVTRMFEQDFHDARKNQRALSHDDRKFIQKAKEGIHRRGDGHYELPLPLRDETIQLPNNRELALSRLRKLRARLRNDETYRRDYEVFMREVIEKGYAERVPAEELRLDNCQIWYIPHHGVYHPKKPGKIRVVFDASAEFKGTSLNRHLLPGPDLTNNLTGVLSRFRKEPVAFMCDIEGMFHQVGVNKEHRNLLRFLWWEDGDIEKPLVEYRMTVHLFGAVSSPGCSNFALKTAADDFEDECGQEASEFVRNDFYVDDGVKSVPSVEHAINLIKNTKTLCMKGGFKLHKFISNRKEVIEAIPVDERAKGVKELDLTKDLLPIERALGVQWFVESDEFHFKAELKDRPLTRRGILSTVSSIYDPLGLIAPFLLQGKKILQAICKDGSHWDDPVPEHLRMQWIKWREDLAVLSQLKVPRCYKPTDFGVISAVELHSFSDASTSGYGQCSYLRMINSRGDVHCALVMAKSRVTPSKPITVPRLELTAALLSVKVSSFLQQELKYDEIPEVFWTDSEVVRGYISNDARRFHTFVANRVQCIRDHTIPDQWRRVSTKENPADEASRGLSAKELINSPRWWSGPDFLRKPLDSQTGRGEMAVISDNDPEVKKTSSFVTKLRPFATLLERLLWFSDWNRAKRAVALCLRLQRNYKTKEGGNIVGREVTRQNKGTKLLDPINVEELRVAEIEIVKAVQKEAFPKEMALLQSANTEQEKTKRSSIKKTSALRRLDPFVDEDGILRVGGRIRHAGLPFNEKHPLLLPKKGHITDLVIRHHHQRSYHQGRGITHARIRSSGVWIVNGNSAVGHHISRCTTCQRYRGAHVKQKMADLPQDRLEETAPFTYSAVDYFGPFYIKEGRRELKRYGVLFTCMSSRAIHLETAVSLTTDSFLNAYRRFIGRRGPVRQLRSDQGSNFVGAHSELKAALTDSDHDTITKELTKNACDWIQFKMNVPSASHMGGAWERQIRTVRGVLSPLLDNHGRQLDDESLRTLMAEAEAIVNSRPLTTDDFTCKETPDPLTPNHLLTQKSQVVLPPPGIFQRADLYSKKRWRRVQHLANEFWQRWKKSYLYSLQSRQKWLRPHKNLQVGDIVILKDDSLPRNRWKLAQVEETYPTNDGYVRKVKLAVSTDSLDSSGKRTSPVVYLERPVHKLILLLSPD